MDRQYTKKEIIDMMVTLMERSGIAKENPAYVYAFKKTGFPISETNEHLFKPEQLKLFYDLMAEYDNLHKDRSND